MPLWLPQTCGFPFRLYRWIMDASLNSCGIASFLHIQWNNSVSLSAMGSPRPYKSQQELHLQLELCQMTVVELLVFMKVGNSCNICGCLSIASSLMLDGRFSTLLKCSAHLFKIASISVRRVLPCGGSRTLWAINGFQCIMKFLHVLSVRERLAKD